MDERFLDELERLTNEGHFNPFCSVKDIQEQMTKEFGMLNFPSDVALAIINLARENAGMPLLAEEKPEPFVYKPVFPTTTVKPYIPKTSKTTDVEPER
jgi:hypothetical protein